MTEFYKDKKYQSDKVFNIIQSRHLSLNDRDTKENNQNLQQIINNGMIPLMKNDPLFKELYQTIKYAGSYYKGTKVGKPDEFDLDLVMKLPLDYKSLLIDTNHKNFGYIKIKIGENSKLVKWNNHCNTLDKWLNNGYLDQDKFRRWMEKVMTKTYDQLIKVDDEYELTVNNKTYRLKPFKKSGPAYTIYIKLKNQSLNNRFMDIDMVPCLEFDDIKLNGYRTITTMPDLIKKVVVVAKPSTADNGNLLWRLSFYAQERQIFLDPEFGKIKNTIRMIKKFRDRQQMKNLASYYIETLCLHEIINKKSEKTFFRASNTSLFIHMLSKLRDAFNSKNLPYFWHNKHNLFINMDPIEMYNNANRINRILNDFEKNFIEDNLILARITLTAIEASRLQNGGCTNKIEKLSISCSDTLVDSTRIEDRVNSICNELNELSKLLVQQKIPADQLQKLCKSCSPFFINN